MGYWTDKRVLVTGGAGMLGGWLVRKLLDAEAVVTVVDDFSRGHSERLEGLNVDLYKCDAAEPCGGAYKGQSVVINLAAKVAGMHYNRRHHATMFYENMRLQQGVLWQAIRAGVPFFCQVSTVCVYPHNQPFPVNESWGQVGDPEETNVGYGWAKRMGERFCEWARQEFDIATMVCRPSNMYGPYDYFDFETSHVIPALTRRFIKGGSERMEVWGTGDQIREFLYAEDSAEAIMALIEAGWWEPVNIGTGMETAVSIGALARLIQEVAMDLGYADEPKEIFFNTEYPDGYPARGTDISTLVEMTGWRPKIGLREGLERTMRWYMEEGKAYD